MNTKLIVLIKLKLTLVVLLSLPLSVPAGGVITACQLSLLNSNCGFTGDVAIGTLDRLVQPIDINRFSKFDNLLFSARLDSGLFSSSIRFSQDQAIVTLDTDVNIGRSVVNVGDVNGDGFFDTVVGIPNFGVSNSGAIQITLGDENGVNLDNNVHIDISNSGAQFGFSVTGAGDINLDGFDDVAVGAPFYSNGENNEGAVFVYLGGPSGLSSSAIRIIEGNRSGAQLGFSVSGNGDINGDGFSDIIMGMPGFIPDTVKSSSRSKGTPSPKGGVGLLLGALIGQIGNLPDAVIEGIEEGARSGKTTAMLGDVNGDGLDDFGVGSPEHSTPGLDKRGAATIYGGSRNISNIQPVAEFVGELANDSVGGHIERLGDINEDEIEDFAIGASGVNNNEGAVYIHQGASSGISEKPRIILEGNHSNAHLGESIVTVGDLNEDGIDEIAVGAPGFTNEQANEGAVFIYESNGIGGFFTEPSRILEIERANASFGSALAFVNQDETRRSKGKGQVASPPSPGQLLVGAPSASNEDSQNQNVSGLVLVLNLGNNMIHFDTFDANSQ